MSRSYPHLEPCAQCGRRDPHLCGRIRLRLACLGCGTTSEAHNTLERGYTVARQRAHSSWNKEQKRLRQARGRAS